MRQSGVLAGNAAQPAGALLMHTHSLVCFVHPLIELVCLAFLVGVPDTWCCLNNPCCVRVDIS